MSTGEKIKHYRKLRKLTQEQLGAAVGVTANAIMNYEKGFRNPNANQLAKIAGSLDVPVEALHGYDVETAREAMELLFRLEDAFGLKPTEDGLLTIDPNAKGAQKLAQAIADWRGVLDEVEAGEMTSEEYETWKASLRD